MKGNILRIKASFNPEKDAVVTATVNPEKRYTLSDVFDGKRVQSASLSPNGKFIIVSYQETYPGGKQSSFTQILDKATGSVLVENGQSLRWMPKSNLALTAASFRFLMRSCRSACRRWIISSRVRRESRRLPESNPS